MLIIYNPVILFIYNVILAKKNGALNLYEQNINFDFFTRLSTITTLA